MSLFLAWIGVDRDSLDLEGEICALNPRLFLVETELSRSKLYHRIKWQLPDDTALLVAPLAEIPKFKGMAEGSTAWARERKRTD
ncbi:hypothetical protein ACFOGJ_28130 [Marinibaculum pumilum]|uniref:Uncharacterized protein n=1 Tax=Marinibaculum pumilum TaxID=1766165 RepID=A0ABV7L932_9PROT